MTKKPKKMKDSTRRKLESLFGIDNKTTEQIEAIEKYSKIELNKRSQMTSHNSVWTVRKK